MPAPTENTPFRSAHGDFGPGDKQTGNAYVLPEANAQVMAHATRNMTYHATRFDSAWAPDRENSISRAIDRSTMHAVIKLPDGMRVDCASGPSSAEPLRASVPVVALAASNCHGTPPPAAVDARAVLAIQMLAPAKPLVDRTQRPAVAVPSPASATKKDACTAAHVLGEHPPVGCGSQIGGGKKPDESGFAMPARSLSVPGH